MTVTILFNGCYSMELKVGKLFNTSLAKTLLSKGRDWKIVMLMEVLTFQIVQNTIHKAGYATLRVIKPSKRFIS